MNSYLKFLSRNKAYAAIDVFGLAISMMFVVLIGCYTWQEWHVDKQHAKAQRLYYLGFDMDGDKILGTNWNTQFLLKDKFPEIESSTGIYRYSRAVQHNDASVETNIYYVDSTFYDLLDFKLIQGDTKRVFSDPANIVVTREYARKVWRDEDPMGKSIQLAENEEPLVVAGIMEPMRNTSFMTSEKRPVDMLVNFKHIKYVNPSLTVSTMDNAADANVLLLAKEGVDLTERKAEYEAALKESFWILRLPEDNIHIEIFPFEEKYFSEWESRHVNAGNPKLIKLLFGVGIVILLFAVMNYINLTVALAGKRAKEMATRRLLGESRSGIMWRLICESTALCTISMLLGIGLAFLMEPYASSLLATHIDILGCLNLLTVSFLIIVLLIMGVASGIIPALLFSSMKPIEAVKGTFKRKSNMVFGKIFIVVQNVATITMIACAITMYLQVRHLIEAPLGYEPEGVISIPYSYTQNHQADGLHFKEELLKLACVEKVSFSQGEPHNRGNNNTFSKDGRTFSFQLFFADSDYMDLLGMKLKKDNEFPPESPRYFLNMRAVNELGIGEDAMSFDFGDGQIILLAGVIEDFMIGNVLADQHPVLVGLHPNKNNELGPWNVLIKVNGDEDEALEKIKEVYKNVYPEGNPDMVFDSPYLTQKIAKDFEEEDRLSVILSIFAIIAILISMLGLIAMSTYYVRQRSKDIAVHKVMGGTSMNVLSRLVRTFMFYVLLAAALAIPLIYYVMNDWLSQFSYRISVYWWIYAVSAVIAVIICFVSVVVQCRRAANTNPIDSLK